MPEYCAVQCAYCGAFQGQQVNKSKSFQCSICHQKQSVLRHFAISNKAKDIRTVVQTLNMERAAINEAQAMPDISSGRHAAAAPKRMSAQPSGNNARWTSYLTDEQCGDNLFHTLQSSTADQDLTSSCFVTELPDHQPAKKKRQYDQQSYRASPTSRDDVPTGQQLARKTYISNASTTYQKDTSHHAEQHKSHMLPPPPKRLLQPAGQVIQTSLAKPHSSFPATAIQVQQQQQQCGGTSHPFLSHTLHQCNNSSSSNPVGSQPTGPTIKSLSLPLGADTQQLQLNKQQQQQQQHLHYQGQMDALHHNQGQHRQQQHRPPPPQQQQQSLKPQLHFQGGSSQHWKPQQPSASAHETSRGQLLQANPLTLPYVAQQPSTHQPPRPKPAAKWACFMSGSDSEEWGECSFTGKPSAPPAAAVGGGQDRGLDGSSGSSSSIGAKPTAHASDRPAAKSKWAAAAADSLQLAGIGQCRVVTWLGDEVVAAE